MFCHILLLQFWTLLSYPQGCVFFINADNTICGHALADKPDLANKKIISISTQTLPIKSNLAVSFHSFSSPAEKSSAISQKMSWVLWSSSSSSPKRNWTLWEGGAATQWTIYAWLEEPMTKYYNAAKCCCRRSQKHRIMLELAAKLLLPSWRACILLAYGMEMKLRCSLLKNSIRALQSKEAIFSTNSIRAFQSLHC